MCFSEECQECLKWLRVVYMLWVEITYQGMLWSASLTIPWIAVMHMSCSGFRNPLQAVWIVTKLVLMLYCSKNNGKVLNISPCTGPELYLQSMLLLAWDERRLNGDWWASVAKSMTRLSVKYGVQLQSRVWFAARANLQLADCPRL